VNGLLCLKWCLEYGHRFPQDYRTALHVRDWLADKAAECAWNDEERTAVDVARRAAINLLRDPTSGVVLRVTES
jgi:hypothetical protein